MFNQLMTNLQSFFYFLSVVTLLGNLSWAGDSANLLHPSKNNEPHRNSEANRATNIFLEIEQRISDAKSRGYTPSLFIDLDETLYMVSSRIADLLHEYDRLNNTHFFRGVNFAQVPSTKFEKFIEERIAKQVLDTKQASSISETVNAYVNKQRYLEDSYFRDLLNLDLADKIREWKSKGAEIIYLTARHTTYEKVTRQCVVERDKLPLDGLIMDKTKQLSSEVFKAQEIESYQKAHPKSEPVLFLDDSLPNILKIREKFPKILSVQVTLRNDPIRLTTQMVLDTPGFAQNCGSYRGFYQWFRSRLRK